MSTAAGVRHLPASSRDHITRGGSHGTLREEVASLQSQTFHLFYQGDALIPSSTPIHSYGTTNQGVACDSLAALAYDSENRLMSRVCRMLLEDFTLASFPSTI